MKKFLKWLIPCLVACFMVAGLVQTASFVSAEQQEVTPDQNQANVPVPDHTKSISGNEQKGYTLTLDVKGKQEIIPGQKTKVDVVLVIDKSGSMGDENSFDMADPDNPNGPKIRRIEALQKIVTGDNGLSQTILGNENLDARMAVVTYSGSKTSENYKDNPNNDANIISGDSVWIGNYTGDYFNNNAYSSIDAIVDRITTDGGTNCESGLVKASEALLTSRGDAQKYVIFLSDGTPTYYYANGNDYYRTKPVWSFAEEAVPENTPNPKENNITPENLGKDVIYGEHMVWDNWPPVTKTEWYRIDESETGWHYIEEEGVGDWKYGKYSYSFTKTYEKGITLGAGDSDSKGWNEIPVPEGEGFNTICSKRAYDAVSKLSGLDGFYTVGVAGKADEAFLKGLLTYSDAKDPKYFPGTDTAELTKAFSDIANNIVNRSLTVSNVTITDTLSDYVELRSSGENGTVKDATIKITDASGKDVPSTEYSEANMVVKYDETTKTVTCDFNDGYSLKENYTYSVSFGVVPSQKAYTEFSKNNGSYGKDESGNKLTGFKSNESATLTYAYGDSVSLKPNTVSYEQEPEIQVSANQLTVTKVVEGKLANKNDEFTFNVDLINNSETLDGNYSFGSVEIKDKKGNNVNDSTIRNQNGNITFKLKDGQTAYLTNLPRNYTYEVTEIASDAYDTTYLTGPESEENNFDTNVPSGTFNFENQQGISITVKNTAKDIAITGITDNTPKGLGLIGSIVVEIAAIAFVLKKKRQLKM